MERSEGKKEYAAYIARRVRGVGERVDDPQSWPSNGTFEFSLVAGRLRGKRAPQGSSGHQEPRSVGLPFWRRSPRHPEGAGRCPTQPRPRPSPLPLRPTGTPSKEAWPWSPSLSEGERQVAGRKMLGSSARDGSPPRSHHRFSFLPRAHSETFDALDQTVTLLSTFDPESALRSVATHRRRVAELCRVASSALASDAVRREEDAGRRALCLLEDADSQLAALRRGVGKAHASVGARDDGLRTAWLEAEAASAALDGVRAARRAAGGGAAGESAATAALNELRALRRAGVPPPAMGALSRILVPLASAAAEVAAARAALGLAREGAGRTPTETANAPAPCDVTRVLSVTNERGGAGGREELCGLGALAPARAALPAGMRAVEAALREVATEWLADPTTAVGAADIVDAAGALGPAHRVCVWVALDAPRAAALAARRALAANAPPWASGSAGTAGTSLVPTISSEAWLLAGLPDCNDSEPGFPRAVAEAVGRILPALASTATKAVRLCRACPGGVVPADAAINALSIWGGGSSAETNSSLTVTSGPACAALRAVGEVAGRIAELLLTPATCSSDGKGGGIKPSSEPSTAGHPQAVPSPGWTTTWLGGGAVAVNAAAEARAEADATLASVLPPLLQTPDDAGPEAPVNLFAEHVGWTRGPSRRDGLSGLPASPGLNAKTLTISPLPSHGFASAALLSAARDVGNEVVLAILGWLDHTAAGIDTNSGAGAGTLLWMAHGPALLPLLANPLRELSTILRSAAIGLDVTLTSQPAAALDAVLAEAEHGYGRWLAGRMPGRSSCSEGPRPLRDGGTRCCAHAVPEPEKWAWVGVVGEQSSSSATRLLDATARAVEIMASGAVLNKEVALMDACPPRAAAVAKELGTTARSALRGASEAAGKAVKILQSSVASAVWAALLAGADGNLPYSDGLEASSSSLLGSPAPVIGHVVMPAGRTAAAALAACMAMAKSEEQVSVAMYAEATDAVLALRASLHSPVVSSGGRGGGAGVYLPTRAARAVVHLAAEFEKAAATLAGALGPPRALAACQALGRICADPMSPSTPAETSDANAGAAMAAAADAATRDARITLRNLASRLRLCLCAAVTSEAAAVGALVAAQVTAGGGTALVEQPSPSTRALWSLLARLGVLGVIAEEFCGSAHGGGRCITALAPHAVARATLDAVASRAGAPRAGVTAAAAELSAFAEGLADPAGPGAGSRLGAADSAPVRAAALLFASLLRPPYSVAGAVTGDPNVNSASSTGTDGPKGDGQRALDYSSRALSPYHASLALSLRVPGRPLAVDSDWRAAAPFIGGGAIGPARSRVPRSSGG